MSDVLFLTEWISFIVRQMKNNSLRRFVYFVWWKSLKKAFSKVARFELSGDETVYIVNCYY